MKKKIISTLLCICMMLGVVASGVIAFADDASAAHTVTVNFVYEANSSFVALPSSFQVEDGAEFKRDVAVPEVMNYSITEASVTALPDGVILTETEGKQILRFDLAAVGDNLSVTLAYEAGSANYSVHNYFQNLADDEYTLDESKNVTLSGSIDAYTQAVANAYEGFTCSGVTQSVIAADGTTEVSIYYDRDYYLVIFNPDGGLNGPEPVYAKYGTRYGTPVAAPVRTGYNFVKWMDDNGNEPSGTVEKSITYTAQWELASPDANVAVVIWGENANDEEYSYIKTVSISAAVGTELNNNTLICGKEAHTHSESCGLNCTHVHGLSCWGLSDSDLVSSQPSGITETNPVSGQVYSYTTGNDKKTQTHYYLYYSGSWYCHHDWRQKVLDISPITFRCLHVHTDECYACGLEEHIHDSSCYLDLNSLASLDSEMYMFDHSDTVTVSADGSTVLNVYYDRTEFTLTFEYVLNGAAVATITGKWGAHIEDEFEAQNAAGAAYAEENGSHLAGWRDSTTTKYLNHIEIMPQTDKTLTAHLNDSDTLNTMHYYRESLSGADEFMFDITFYGSGYTVTADEYYEIEGFTINKSRSTAIGSGCNGATFYYTRNTYHLEFYSGTALAKTETPKYQQPLSGYDWTPAAPPSSMESDAVFVGWYQNPQCTGDGYDLAAHTMPANHIALYAKWQNRSYTVKTYTDSTLVTLYAYDGYTGSQTVEKYTTAAEPIEPSFVEGKVFVGWFYTDGGTEKAFSFTMPITRDYNLYPKWSDRVNVSYVVHYYIAGTATKLADDKNGSALIGSTVTEKARVGTELNLVTNGKLYFPTLTSTSVRLTSDGQEIVFYYTEATEMTYTVYYLEMDTNATLVTAKSATTSLSSVIEDYAPVDGYTPDYARKGLDLSTDPSKNVITFWYTKNAYSIAITKEGCADESESFLFDIVNDADGTDTLTVVIIGNGTVTLNGLSAASYTVTERSGAGSWSWRYKELGPQTASSSNNNLVFTNMQDENRWLDGNSSAVNNFNAPSGE